MHFKAQKLRVMNLGGFSLVNFVCEHFLSRKAKIIFSFSLSQILSCLSQSNIPLSTIFHVEELKSLRKNFALFGIRTRNYSSASQVGIATN
jgi:hypothetical protein